MLLKLMNVTDFHETLNWKENLNAVFLSVHTDNYNHNNSTFFYTKAGKWNSVHCRWNENTTLVTVTGYPDSKTKNVQCFQD